MAGQTGVHAGNVKEKPDRSHEIFQRVGRSHLVEHLAYLLERKQNESSEDGPSTYYQPPSSRRAADTPTSNASRTVNGSAILSSSPFNPNTVLILLDVRTPEEYSTNHIYGALSYPVLSIKRDVITPELYSFKNQENRAVVVYGSQHGEEAPEAATLLIQKYFERVYVLNGGLEGMAALHPTWVEGALPLIPSTPVPATPVPGSQTPIGGIRSGYTTPSSGRSGATSTVRAPSRGGLQQQQQQGFSGTPVPVSYAPMTIRGAYAPLVSGMVTPAPRPPSGAGSGAPGIALGRMHGASSAAGAAATGRRAQQQMALQGQNGGTQRPAATMIPGPIPRIDFSQQQQQYPQQQQQQQQSRRDIPTPMYSYPSTSTGAYYGVPTSDSTSTGPMRHQPGSATPSNETFTLQQYPPTPSRQQQHQHHQQQQQFQSPRSQNPYAVSSTPTASTTMSSASGAADNENTFRSVYSSSFVPFAPTPVASGRRGKTDSAFTLRDMGDLPSEGGPVSAFHSTLPQGRRAGTPSSSSSSSVYSSHPYPAQNDRQTHQPQQLQQQQYVYPNPPAGPRGPTPSSTMYNQGPQQHQQQQQGNEDDGSLDTQRKIEILQKQIEELQASMRQPH